MEVQFWVQIKLIQTTKPQWVHRVKYAAEECNPMFLQCNLMEIQEFGVVSKANLQPRKADGLVQHWS